LNHKDSGNFEGWSPEPHVPIDPGWAEEQLSGANPAFLGKVARWPTAEAKQGE
jgi:hypothetical protein